MVRLTHFSEGKFIFDPKRSYPPVDNPYALKPEGLWLSDKESYGWRQWCEESQFGLERLRVETSFVCDVRHWVVLSEPREILEFGEKFSVEIPGSPAISQSRIFVDWKRVRKEYAGILISPSCWDMRLHHRAAWYYCWDCASACVWDLSTVMVALD